jgi:N-acetylmuramoyl-L-alanine amidase
VKKKLYALFFITLFLFGAFSIRALKQEDFPLLGKVIYLDPGHGGTDPGAEYKDIYEKNINLSISLKLQEELGKLGAIVYLTRDGDYDLSVPNTINRKRSDLSRRSNIINNSLCDLFLSIHLNAESSGKWRGPQIFYDDASEDNKKIAELFQKELNKNLKGNREMKEVSDLYLQKRIKRPGVLVEVGFLSNASDRYLLKSETYQQKVALVLKNAVLKYFKS